MDRQLQTKNRAWVIITSLEWFEVKKVICFSFKASNNEAEYEALLVGLCLARSLAVTRIRAHSDLQLVVRQFLGEYQAREQKMIVYPTEVKILAITFE